MGLFGQIKDAMEAGQQIADGSTKVSVFINNESVKIGDSITGTITVTSTQPAMLDAINIDVRRQPRDDFGSNTTNDEKTWFFNKETISINAQLSPNVPAQFPFTFVVNNGLGDNLNFVQNESKFSIGLSGIKRSVEPEISANVNHMVYAMAKLNGQNFGPFASSDVRFSYPSTFNL